VPKGPNGERRTADAIGQAVTVVQTAARELEDTGEPLKIPNRAKGGRKGGHARAAAETAR